MTKEELLQAIAASAREGNVSREEMMKAYDNSVGAPQASVPSERRHVDISEILYYLGGGIVVLGVGIFIGQNWDTLSVLTRILSTLGVGIVMYALGAVLFRAGRRTDWGQAFHLIAAFTLPMGMFVTLDQFHVGVADGIASIVFAFLAAWYALSYRLFGKNMFVLFTVIFTTIFFFVFTNFLISGTALFDGGDFVSYQFLVTGLVYLLLGYIFTKRSEASLVPYLYSFGLVFFLGAALSLCGYAPDHNWFWELIFPGLALGAAFLSLPLRSRAFLVFGSLFLVIYILKITGEYFTEGLGWPLALILAGLALIAVGALFVRLNARYRNLPRPS